MTVIVVGRTREERRRAVAPVAGLDPHQRPDFLYLCATRRKADVVRAAWWDQPDKPPTFLPDARPWGAFRDELAARWGGGRALLPPEARELLAGAVFRSLQPRLRVWGGLRDGPETRRSLAAFAEEWALGFVGSKPPPIGAEPYNLRFPGEPDHTWGPLFSSTSAVSPAVRQDAWFFLRAWRSALERSGAWTDRAGLTRGLLATLRAPPPQLLAALASWGAVIVDDLLWLPPLERATLQAFLAAYAEARPTGQVHLCLEAPVHGDEERARAWLAGEDIGGGLGITRALRVAWAEQLGDEDGPRLLVADGEAATEDLADLVERDGIVETPAITASAVRARRYPSAQAEVRAIARALKAELLAGRRADELFVSFPELDAYAPLLRDVLTAYGVPFVIEKGEELLHSPPASAARQLLRLATVEPDPGALRSLLASGWIRAWFPVDAAMAEPLLARLDGPLGARGAAVREAAIARVEEAVAVRPDLERLQPIVTMSGASGRPADWLPDLAAWRLRRAEDQLARARGDEDRARRIDARLVKDLASYILDVLALERLLETLDGLRQAPSLREAAARLLELLGTVGIRPEEPGPDLDRVRARAMRANAAAIETLVELVQELARSLDGVQRATPDTQRRRPVVALRDALEEAVRRARYRGAGPRVGVQIVGLRDLHGADVPWLWVGGLSDGAFPRSPRPSFLLPRTEPPLVAQLDRAAEDRAIFASLLRSVGHGARRTSSHLILSWPQTASGKNLVPSPVVADLLELRTPNGTLNSWWAARQTAEEAQLPPLLSRDELLTRPDLCAQLPPPAPLSEPDPLDDPADATEPLPLLSAPDRRAMRSWDALVAARTDERGFGAWDGVLGMDTPWRNSAVGWVRELLGVVPGRQGRPTLSMRTTGLEQWAKCPIRFFFQSVLGLDEPRPFAMAPGKDEEGTLVHEVLERFIAERIDLRNQGASTAAIWKEGPMGLQSAGQRLREIAEQVAEDRMGHRRGPWIARLVSDLVAGLPGAEEQGWQGLLARYLAEDARGPFLDAEPAHVEYAFDGFSPASAAFRLAPKDRRDPVFRAGTGDVDVRLRGSIDRVDLPLRRSYGGRPQGDGGLRAVVYDYKTGWTPHVKEIDHGLALQPAVYPMAIDVPWYAAGLVSGYWDLRNEPGAQRKRLAVSMRLWRYLRDQRGLQRPKGFKFTTEGVTMWRWRAWLVRADLYGQMVAAGVFPPTLQEPKVAGCRYCPFRRACRTDPIRTERVLNPAPARPGVTPPVFWPTAVSVQDGLDAMFGAWEVEEPDQEPEPEPEAPQRPRSDVVLPTPGPVKTDEFDELFDEVF